MSDPTDGGQTLPPPTPPPAKKSGGGLKAIVALAAAAVLGVGAYLVFFSGDDDESSPATTVADGGVGDPHESVDDAVVAALQQRIAELEGQLAEGSGVDSGELEALLGQLAAAEARAEAAEAALAEIEAAPPPDTVPASIDVGATIDATLPAFYDITWGEPTTCQGLEPCDGVGGPMDRFYIDLDGDTGQFRLVAPDVIGIPLVQQGLNFTGTAVAVDSKWECPTDGVTATGTMTVVLTPGSFDTADGTTVVGSLVGDVEFAVEATQCPALYFTWSIAAARS